MKNLTGICAVIFAMSHCGGCATVMTGGGHTQNIRMATNPVGATVYVDESFVGVTPISSPLARNGDHHVRIEMAGYEPKNVEIKSNFNGWIFGNLLIGGWVGMIVDGVSGTMEGSITPTNIDVKMTPRATALRPDEGLGRYGGWTPTGGYVAPSEYSPNPYLNK